MSSKRSFILLATLVLLVIATFIVKISATRAAAPASPAAVIAWNAIAQRAAIQVAKQPQTQSMIVISFYHSAEHIPIERVLALSPAPLT